MILFVSMYPAAALGRFHRYLFPSPIYCIYGTIKFPVNLSLTFKIMNIIMYVSIDTCVDWRTTDLAETTAARIESELDVKS